MTSTHVKIANVLPVLVGNTSEHDTTITLISETLILQNNLHHVLRITAAMFRVNKQMNVRIRKSVYTYMYEAISFLGK